MSGTNLGRMPILIVSLVIGIVMATTAIVPLVSDYSDAKTFTNDGLYRVDVYDNTVNFTAKWEYTKPFQLTINGDVVVLPNTLQTVDMTLMCSDNFIFRYNAGSNPYVQVYGESLSGTYVANVSNSSNMDITVSAGTITFDNGSGTTKQITYTGNMYACSNDGDFIMKYYNQDAYILEDSLIYAVGRTYILSINFTTVLNGTIENMTRSFWPVSDVSSLTFGDINVNVTPVGGYEDLYSFTSFNWTVSDGSDTKDMTYSQVIVPYEVTADTDNPAAYKALVKVIPVMAFVALIAAAAYMIYSKRD